MDLPPELKVGIFLLLSTKEVKDVGEVFPETVDDSYFKANHQYTHNSLNRCCMKGLIEGVRLHLKKTDDVNSASKLGSTSLHYAVTGNHIAIVQLLLNDQRIEVNSVDAYGVTPYFIACLCGHETIVTLLDDVLSKAGL